MFIPNNDVLNDWVHLYNIPKSICKNMPTYGAFYLAKPSVHCAYSSVVYNTTLPSHELETINSVHTGLSHVWHSIVQVHTK